MQAGGNRLSNVVKTQRHKQRAITLASIRWRSDGGNQ
jgi:hypothetical protein